VVAVVILYLLYVLDSGQWALLPARVGFALLAFAGTYLRPFDRRDGECKFSL
jgi:hypothetical protein